MKMTVYNRPAWTRDYLYGGWTTRRGRKSSSSSFFYYLNLAVLEVESSTRASTRGKGKVNSFVLISWFSQFVLVSTVFWMWPPPLSDYLLLVVSFRYQRTDSINFFFFFLTRRTIGNVLPAEQYLTINVTCWINWFIIIISFGGFYTWIRMPHFTPKRCGMYSWR